MAGSKVAALARFLLPGWVSDAALAVLFLLIWLFPEVIGWHQLEGVRLLIVIEIWILAASTLVLAGHGERLAWMPLILVVPAVAIGLGAAIGIVPAVFIAVRLLGSLATTLRDSGRAQLAYSRAGLSLAVMVAAYASLSMGPAELGWTEAATPAALWVRTLGENATRIPQGVPAWGTLYFAGLLLVEALRLPDRFEQYDREHRPRGA